MNFTRYEINCPLARINLALDAAKITNRSTDLFSSAPERILSSLEALISFHFTELSS